MNKVMKLVDVQMLVDIAVDSTMTLEEVRQWVDDAIMAKLDAERELEDWGGGVTRVYINGPCASILQ